MGRRCAIPSYNRKKISDISCITSDYAYYLILEASPKIIESETADMTLRLYAPWVRVEKQWVLTGSLPFKGLALGLTLSEVKG